MIGQCVDLGQRGRRVRGGGQRDIDPVGAEPVGQPSTFPVERCAVGPGVPHGVLVGGSPRRIVPVPVPQFRQGADRVAGGWQRRDTGQHQRTRREGDRMQTDAVPQVSGGFAGCGQRGMLRRGLAGGQLVGHGSETSEEHRERDLAARMGCTQRLPFVGDPGNPTLSTTEATITKHVLTMAYLWWRPRTNSSERCVTILPRTR